MSQLVRWIDQVTEGIRQELQEIAREFTVCATVDIFHRVRSDGLRL